MIVSFDDACKLESIDPTEARKVLLAFGQVTVSATGKRRKYSPGDLERWMDEIRGEASPAPKRKPRKGVQAAEGGAV